MADGVDDEVVELPYGGGRSRGDPGAHAAELKRKLDSYCTAVAKSMVANSQESLLGYSNSSASGTSQLISQASFSDDGDGAILVRTSNVIGKPVNSGTSKQQSDDFGNLEVQIDPSNAKKIRRLLLNRESARRSRKRKETHLRDLESQVSRLTSENASLLKRLADMTEKYKYATLDNRNIIADIDNMRTKLNIAEEATRRLTGTTLLLSSTSEIHPRTITFSSCVSEVASPAVAFEDTMKHFLQAPLQDNQNKPGLQNAAIAFDHRGDGHHADLSVMRCMLGEPAEEDA